MSGRDKKGRGINLSNDRVIRLTSKQMQFVNATAFEVLFGGAAGGGKSYGQVQDAWIYALQYPKSKQIIFRRTFSDLEKSIIRTAQSLYHRDVCSYNNTKHSFLLKNGSIIDFGYCTTDNDVYQYQSAEYDVIRFDELTHFTEFQYIYLISRCRGSNNYPRHIKSSTNPGGVGHSWVKARFIDPAPPNTEFTIKGSGTTAVFIPAMLTDNPHLMKNDPDYIKRLDNLPEHERKALKDGEWNLNDGQYFHEFKYEIHTCKPFAIPKTWRRYRAIDYGLDAFACLWIAVSDTREVFVYRELCQKDSIISNSARLAKENTFEGEHIYCTFAPPDMWGRSQESGKSKALLFAEHDLRLTKSSNDREAGWLAIHELLHMNEDGFARLHIFQNCTELIKCLPLLQIDPRKPTDCMTEPHDITHICLTGDTIVNTEDGDYKIRDLVGKEGRVFSYDTFKQKMVIKEFSNVCLTQKDAELVEIILDDGRTIKCTPDHPILTLRGWVPAQELEENEDIIEVNYG